MTRHALAAVLALAAACGPRGAFRGPVDMARVEGGEVWLDRVALPGGKYMMRGVTAVDAPPWRVWNVFVDLESHPLWFTGKREVKVVRRDAASAEIVVEPSRIGWFDLDTMHEPIRSPGDTMTPDRRHAAIVSPDRLPCPGASSR